MTAALTYEGVCKRFGRRTALDGLSLSVPAGAIYGLVGSNGAGKTTALAVAGGLLRIQAGRVDVLQSGPFHADRHAGRITLLPQDAALPPEARPLDLLCFYAELQGVPAAEARRQAWSLLEHMHLADRARSAVRTLSHGMRKRVMVAQCFLGTPELVLLDEPLSGLDPREVVRLREFLAARRGQMTLVISSHNLHEIELLCDHVGFMEHGRCTREDTLDRVTGRSAVMVYQLAAGPPPPVETFAATLAGADLQYDPATRRLICRCRQPGPDPATVNGHVLPWLLQAGCGVVEVRQGGRLEEEYLRSAESGPRGQGFKVSG